MIASNERRRDLPIACVFLFVVAAAQAEVPWQIGQNFASSTYGFNSQALPPDPNGTIGPRHFVEFINGSFTVYNKTNGQSVKRISDLKFWSDAGLIISPDAGVSDPRIIYDPSSQRWFASMVDLDAFALDPTLEANDFLLAVSAGADPTGPWKAFMIVADPDSGTFADFPTLGVDANAVYLSGDMFVGSDNPVGPTLLSFPKSDLLLPTPVITNRTWFGVMDYAVRGQVLQPAICLDGSASGRVLAMGDIGSDSDPHSNMVAFAVLNGNTPSATLSAPLSISISPYVVPFNSDQGFPLFTVEQPDASTTLSGNDARLSGRVFAVRGVLYAVHSTELNGRMAVRWYRIDAATSTVLESGTIADPNQDLFYPAIAANANGIVVIVCNGAGPGTVVSCYAAVGQIVSGNTTFGNLTPLQSGSVSYHGDDELLLELLDLPPLSRWGDYSTVTVDPSDAGHFWTIMMYPTDIDVWSTQITELIMPPLQLSITAAGANVDISWPATYVTGFQLQSSSQPGNPASWSNVSQTPGVVGNTAKVVLPIAPGLQFFRLVQL